MIKKIIIGLIVFIGILGTYFIYNSFFLEDNVIQNDIIEEYEDDENLINSEETLDFKYKSIWEVWWWDTY